jgi:hypothetical protein
MTEKLCAQWAPLVSHVELLKLSDNFREEKKWREATAQWLGFLRPFNAVQTLHLCGISVVSHVANILGELEGKEVLPALHTVELVRLEQGESEILRVLEPFLAVREGLGHPVVVNFVFRH